MNITPNELWFTILSALGGQGILLAAIVYLSRALVSNLMAKELRQFEISLKLAAEQDLKRFEVALRAEKERPALLARQKDHEDPEGGFWAEVPALPGCYSQGETLDELRENVREAIAGVLEVMREQGRQPESNIQILDVAV